ncbi:ABC transporter permease [Bacillus sp. SA1-12]|nr:ABC transporter permease [Bacillus sp. SA1-12]
MLAKKKRINATSIGAFFVSILLFLYFVAIAYPLFWMVINSFKDTKSIFTSSWAMPETWLVSNYVEAWSIGVSTYFLNSVIVTSLTCLLTVLCGALCAYALARFHLKGEKLFLLFVSAGLMFAPQVALIPLYELTQSLGIYDTYWALVLPFVAYRLPLSILIIRAFFLSIPKELEEAARIDGCNSFQIFYIIFLPISKPVIFTTIILAAYFAWNEILFSVIFIQSEEVKPITAGLLVFRDALRTDWGVLMAGLVMSAIPLILLFIFTQKYFIRGLAAGSIKG